MHRESLGPAPWTAVESALLDLGAEASIRSNATVKPDELLFRYDEGFLFLEGRLGTLIALEVQLARRVGEPILRVSEDIDRDGTSHYAVYEVDGEAFKERAEGRTDCEHPDFEDWIRERVPPSVIGVLPSYRFRTGHVLRPERPSEPKPVEVVTTQTPKWRLEEKRGSSATLFADDSAVIKATAREETVQGLSTLVVRCRLLDKTYESSRVLEVVNDLWVKPSRPQTQSVLVRMAHRSTSSLTYRP